VETPGSAAGDFVVIAPTAERAAATSITPPPAQSDPIALREDAEFRRIMGQPAQSMLHVGGKAGSGASGGGEVAVRRNSRLGLTRSTIEELLASPQQPVLEELTPVSAAASTEQVCVGGLSKLRSCY
jgi:hypothetical protein